MLEIMKIILLIGALLLNYRNRNMVAIILITAFDILMPIPSNAGRAVWCEDCMIVDGLAGFLVLFFDTGITFALCTLCFSLIPVHLIYLQAGRANFPEYGVVVPIIEFAMLFFCVIGSTNKPCATIHKYFHWMFSESKQRGVNR
jgi:hypothetical protein